MHRFNYFRVLLFLFFFTMPIFSQTHPNPEVQLIITNGLSSLINHDYTSARSQFSILLKKYPQNPMGKILMAGTDLFYAHDYMVPVDEAKSSQMLGEASRMADRLIKIDESNAWYKYYKALAEGYRAYFLALNDNWFKALTTGFSAKGLFADCLELDSTFYDANVAIGAWKYWSSEKTEFINWLPIVSDERMAGIELLHQAISKKAFHAYHAVHNLSWIYIHRKEYDKALALVEPMVQKYPKSRFFMWDYARIFEDTDKRKAIEIYEKLLKMYPLADMPNRAVEMTLRYIIAKNFIAIGEKVKASAYLKGIPAENLMTDWEKQALGDRIGKIKKLKELVNH